MDNDIKFAKCKKICTKLWLFTALSATFAAVTVLLMFFLKVLSIKITISGVELDMTNCSVFEFTKDFFNNIKSINFLDVLIILIVLPFIIALIQSIIYAFKNFIKLISIQDNTLLIYDELVTKRNFAVSDSRKMLRNSNLYSSIIYLVSIIFASKIFIQLFDFEYEDMPMLMYTMSMVNSVNTIIVLQIIKFILAIVFSTAGSIMLNKLRLLFIKDNYKNIQKTTDFENTDDDADNDEN